MRRLGALFKGLEHYVKVVDVLSNGTPYLAWMWTPITLILRVASEYIEAFEQIIKGYSRIAETLKSFEFLGDASSKLWRCSTPTYFSSTSWKLLFLTSWGRHFQRRLGNILQDMERHGALVDKEAHAASQRQPILWLQGGPGSGKNVLSTQLVNFMKATKILPTSTAATPSGCDSEQ
ncbi:hypothetical protein F5X96DRAFT_691616 [Biscogniauxia mediterranea]|nr:hypothetical protein F5X96DRAFT_691616 [Biscogniauxia mediterranea]